MICHLMTQTPSMVMDFLNFANVVNKNAFATVALTMTKLHYSLLPMAIICFLPWKRQTVQDQHQLKFLYRQRNRQEQENKELLEKR